jgi:hypothetical protein
MTWHDSYEKKNFLVSETKQKGVVVSAGFIVIDAGGRGWQLAAMAGNGTWNMSPVMLGHLL